jgi:hypothetical protein
VRRAWIGLGLALGLAAAAFAAEPRRIESVGVAPVKKDAPATASPRNAALTAAVARAVERVALELEPSLPKPTGEKSKDPTKIAPELVKALGKDPLDYATRYRVLQDRGLRPALFGKETGAEKEYVVVVEVQVDAERVAERLRAAGWLSSGAPNGAGQAPLQLVLEGVTDYRAYASVRKLLVEKLGARSALPLEFRPGEAVLAVTGGPTPETLAASLQAAAPPELRVVPLEAGPDSVRLQVEWTPPAAPEPAAELSPTAETPVRN